MLPAPPLVLLVLLTLAPTFQGPPQPGCDSSAECRDLALKAAAEREFETFHDLAWRAVQKGRRNDPELMLMLARAQSLSGRPLDALVMLGRAADQGAAIDASGDDFARVRALPGWPDVERRIAEATARSKPAAPPAVSPEPARPTASKPATPAEPTAAEPPPASSKTASPETAPAARVSAPEMLRFAAGRLDPSGLAYDAVSRRFILGDREGRKLSVIDEFSHQVAVLAGAQTAGFGDVAALEIDPRDGTLWIVSGDRDADAGKTTLHKLQLISGRSLATFAPGGTSSSRFVDVAVAPRGNVLVLDAGERRVLTLEPRGGALVLAAALGEIVPRSIAPAGEQSAYVSHDRGLVRIDLASGRASAIAIPARLRMGPLSRMRWHKRSLLGIEDRPDGSHRAVRLRLSADGRSITRLDVIDDAAHPGAAALSGDTFYYLGPGGDGEMIVRQAAIR